jgi:hypothetical protein
MAIYSRPALAAPATAASFADKPEACSSKRRTSFLCQCVRDELFISKSPCRATTRAVKQRICISRSICSNAVDFKSPPVINKSRNGPSADSNPANCSVRRTSDAELRAGDGFVVPMMFSDELIGFLQCYRHQLKIGRDRDATPNGTEIVRLMNSEVIVPIAKGLCSHHFHALALNPRPAVFGLQPPLLALERFP